MAVHVGEILKDEIVERGIKQKEFAVMTGEQPSHISELLKGKRNLTTDLALKIEECLHISARYLMRFQAEYEHDIEVLKKRTIEEQEAYNELSEYDKVVDTETILKFVKQDKAPVTKKRDIIYNLCGNKRPAEMQVADTFNSGYFRKANVSVEDKRMINTWIVLAQYSTREIITNKPFAEDNIPNLVSELRTIFNENRNTLQRVANTCGKYGIKFTVCERVKSTRIDGYSFYESDTPCIVVTNRYNRIDSLAFNVLHELGHIKCSPKTKHLNLEEYDKEDNDERMADAFANNILIPNDVWSKSPRAKMNTRNIQSVFTKWANEQQINKWIVLGRIGYELKIYNFTDKQGTRHIQ